MAAFKTDTRKLRAMGSRLRKSQPILYRQMQATLRSEGKRLAREAQAKASTWSTRIPDTIKSKVSGVNTLKLSAGGANAPHAPAYEHAGATGTFRHPLNFPGQDAWVSEDARPFLHPAVFDNFDYTKEAVRSACQVGVEEIMTIEGL